MSLWWVYDRAEEGAHCVEAASADEAWTAACPLLGIDPPEPFDSIEYAVEPVTAADIAELQSQIERLTGALHEAGGEE